MPAATTTQAAKGEREERLLAALKSRILKERQKQKEEQEVEQERLRKERERQDVLTLGETREKIQKLDQKLQELRNHKQQLFMQLKKVVNEDELRKRQQQQLNNEMFAMHAIQPQPTQHQQIFLPPRQTHQPMLHKNQVGVGNSSSKRERSPSPPPPQSYYKSAAFSPSQKIDDGRRVGEMPRVLWNKAPQYQGPHGTLFYPTTNAPPLIPADTRPQTIIYRPYNSGMSISPQQSYHVEMAQPQQQQPPPPQQQQLQGHPQKTEQPPKPTQIYQAPPPTIGQPSQSMPPQQVQLKPQVTMEKLTDRGGYHVEVKLDPTTNAPHLPDGLVYTPLIPGISMHAPVMQMAPNQSQNSKTGPQGYRIRDPGHNQPPPMPAQPPPQQQQQMHYQRRLY